MTATPQDLEMKLLSLRSTVVAIALCTTQGGCAIEDDSDGSDGFRRELRAELESDAVIEALIPLLDEQGLAIEWDALETEDDGTVTVPLIGADDAIAQNLVFTHGEDGSLVVATENVEVGRSAGIDDLQSNSAPQGVVPPPSCNIGTYDFGASCGVASSTPSGCAENQKLYQKKYYNLDYYTNGRVRSNTPFQTLYSCGPIGSDLYCSSVCYSDDLGPW